ncbi:MAG: hypothetical protein GY719_28325 [bacterium]|nr:hypothetical protein [bacterium]
MTSLQDVLQELVATVDRPDEVALEDFVGRYPQFAAELTDFAVEWVLQETLEEEEPADAADASAVPEAMAHFRETLRETLAERQASTADPFADRSPAELARIAGALSIDKTILAKLRDRKIVAETVPDTLLEGLCGELAIQPQVMAAHLAAPARLHAGVSFKAAAPPRSGPKETFAEAVRRSTLAAEDKSRWLAD